MSVLKARTREAVHSVFNSGTVMGTVLPANHYRQGSIFQNNGTAIAYFGFSTAISGGTAGTALQLSASGSFELDQHVGAVYGIGGPIQVVEFVESTPGDIRAATGGPVYANSSEPYGTY